MVSHFSPVAMDVVRCALTKRYDVKDSSGRKIGEVHERPDYEGMAGRAAGNAAFGCLGFGFTAFGRGFKELHDDRNQLKRLGWTVLIATIAIVCAILLNRLSSLSSVTHAGFVVIVILGAAGLLLYGFSKKDE